MKKGIVIGGEFGKVIARQKSDSPIELGELVIAELPNGEKALLQAIDLTYASQLSQQNLELISGMHLEENEDISFFDPNLRNYHLAVLKSLITLKGGRATLAKSLPPFFSPIRALAAEDLSFLTTPKNPMFLGSLRSGSKEVNMPIYLNGKDMLCHHVLIAAATGKGKSNLMAGMLWDTLGKDYAGILVLDPHDEYYGRAKHGLKDHSQKDRLVYYTPASPPPGARTLKINLELLKPQHFYGVVDWSDAQQQALAGYYKKYGKSWIEAIVLDKPLPNDYHEGTVAVVKRRVMALLDLSFENNQLFCDGIFDITAGATIITDMVREVTQGKTVIVDTSHFSGAVELLVGTLVATELFHFYRSAKGKGNLSSLPVAAIVLEEAPRVLGKDVLERGPNIFSTVAREGRKFQVGLVAITQLPSLIPRDILANMNTKIILGIEMKPEREAIMQSAAQDLSDDDRNIASLDKGEAIISSTFTKFAIPIKVPLFEDLKTQGKKDQVKTDFSELMR